MPHAVPLTDDHRKTLIARRKELAMTQAALAKMLYKSRPLITQIESGAKLPSKMLLLRIAKVLKLKAVVSENWDIRLTKCSDK